MRLVGALCLLAVGCDTAFGIRAVSNPDAALVADVLAPSSDGGICFGTGAGLIAKLCVPPMVTVPAALTATSINTDSTCAIELLQKDGPSLCVVVAHAISIANGATLSARGSHPLLLLGEDSITISGTLDVSSSLTGVRGAGADSDCITTGIDGPPSQTGGAGGAGGSFGNRGGMGGGGSGVGGGAPAASIQSPLIVRGGCPGGGGGASNTPGTAETHGGGAVYLMSGQQITVAGTIDASGAGGAHGFNASGASGGGSGGLIAFDAPTVVVEATAKVFANGGGGGQGGVPLAASGLDPTAPLTIAAGGNNGNDVAIGGNGAAAMTSATAGQSGGGGGGGGAGRILVYSPAQMVPSTAVSPPPG